MSKTATGAATIAALLATLPAQGDLLYTINNGDGNLRAFDLQTALTVATLPITAPIGAATACNGMTRDPTTGLVYALVRFPGSNARQLCTIDVTTGAASVIGVMGDSFSGLACRVDGQLFGVTGDGANFPEALFAIDKTTSAATLVTVLGNGNDGESIAFADNTMLYHASGYNVPIANEVFETVDTFGSNAINPVPMSGYDFDELTGLGSYTGDILLGADLNDDLVAITTAGHVTLVATLDHGTVRGLVWVPSPNTQGFLRPYGTGCAATSGEIPMLFGSGTAVAGQTVGIHLRFAPATSFGIFALGFGNAATPVPSPICQVQVSGVIGSTGFFTGAAGDALFSIAIPPGFLPIDLYLQSGVIDGASFVVSNPMQMHTQ